METEVTERTLSVTNCDECPFLYHAVCHRYSKDEGEPPPRDCMLRECRVVVRLEDGK